MAQLIFLFGTSIAAYAFFARVSKIVVETDFWPG